MTWLKALGDLGACHASLIWAERFSTWEECWGACDRADWLMWIVGRLSGRAGDPRRITLALCASDIAETALPYAGDAHLACEKAIATIRSWARGEATINDLRAAARASYAADAAARAAAYAARAAAYAAAYAAANAAATAIADAAATAIADAADAADADAADAASYAAAFAARAAAYATAGTAAYAAHTAASDKVLRDLCEIVRRHYPSAPSLTEVSR